MPRFQAELSRGLCILGLMKAIFSRKHVNFSPNGSEGTGFQRNTTCKALSGCARRCQRERRRKKLGVTTVERDIYGMFIGYLWDIYGIFMGSLRIQIVTQVDVFVFLQLWSLNRDLPQSIWLWRLWDGENDVPSAPLSYPVWSTPEVFLRLNPLFPDIPTLLAGDNIDILYMISLI